MSARASRNGQDARGCLRDSNGAVVIELSWQEPVSPWPAMLSNGTAALVLVDPSVELVPLLSYAFQMFQWLCAPPTSPGITLPAAG